METEKTVLRKEDRRYYTARDVPEIVDFGEHAYMMLEGRGPPGGEEFEASIEALYTTAYRVKMNSKKEGTDFSVSNLEAQWWSGTGVISEDMSPEDWQWNLLIRVPEFVGIEAVDSAKDEVLTTKQLERARKVRLGRINDGKCIQILHMGPYDREPESIAKIMSYASEKGLKPWGRFREVYISDPGRTSPEKLKTILRQPVE